MKPARMKNRVKMGPVVFMLGLILAAAFFGIQHLKSTGKFDKIAADAKKSAKVKKGDKAINVAVVTWGGYAGGQYFNNGFKDSDSSRFTKDYGLDVNFVLENDMAKSLEMWKKDEIQVHWATADAFSTLLEDLKDYDPKIIFQSDWSRGGDAIVANRTVKSVADLKGRKVAVAFKTPSQSLLIKTLEANNMTINDINVVEAPSAVEAAQMFKDGTVEAAVVWSPDDEICINEVNGAKVLTSTKDATNIIADVFFVKGAWAEANPELIKKLVEGWMTGNAEINTSAEAKTKAIKILSKGLDQNESDCEKAIQNVRLATFEDNKNFFGLTSGYKGIGGEDIYKSMGKIYGALKYAPSNLPKWSDVVSRDHFRDMNLTGSIHKAEPVFTFAAKATDTKAEAFASKDVTINFASGSVELTDDAKYTLDQDVVNILQTFGAVKVRVEGNTDNVGAIGTNISISKGRAQAVVNYLVQTYGFDKNKFVVVGNGPNNPVADNNSSEGQAANRRTEIKFIK